MNNAKVKKNTKDSSSENVVIFWGTRDMNGLLIQRKITVGSD